VVGDQIGEQRSLDRCLAIPDQETLKSGICGWWWRCFKSQHGIVWDPRDAAACPAPGRRLSTTTSRIVARRTRRVGTDAVVPCLSKQIANLNRQTTEETKAFAFLRGADLLSGWLDGTEVADCTRADRIEEGNPS
jgi:hypothetical protein